MLELKDLNDIEISIPEISDTSPLAEAKQYFLNQFEIAFAKHLLEFKKAYALGKGFAKKVTDESNS